MNITREQLIKRVAEESGYLQKNVRDVFNCLNDIIPQYFSEVTDDDDVTVQLIEGCRLKAKVVQERERVDPRTQTPIICPNTVKLGVKYSDVFKKKVQTQYDSKKDG